MKSTWMKRGAGILLPVSSLPSKYGIGTFGKAARKWVDFLAAAQQHNENEISEYGAMLSGVLHLSPTPPSPGSPCTSTWTFWRSRACCPPKA